ncbi:MAG: hypothetical protein EXR86_12450 [Gammaproteobacteria bacterium]|nr:hypothetical protein [Gammaproteobacteria bacterium]
MKPFIEWIKDKIGAWWDDHGELIAAATLLAVTLSLNGCQALREGETRKITAWGVWGVFMGAPMGVGYWHSERGDEIKSEQSAKPSDASKLLAPLGVRVTQP